MRLGNKLRGASGSQWLVTGVLLWGTTISHSSETFKRNQRTACPRAKETRIPSLPDLISIPLALTKKRRCEITIISFSRSICRGELAALIGVTGKPYPSCLSCHSHPIRPCGAPSPRGEGCDAGEAVFSFCSLYRWCSGQRICMTAE